MIYLAIRVSGGHGRVNDRPTGLPADEDARGSVPSTQCFIAGRAVLYSPWAAAMEYPNSLPL